VQDDSIYSALFLAHVEVRIVVQWYSQDAKDTWAYPICVMFHCKC